MSILFPKTIRRYTFSAWTFIKMRESLRLSPKDFAERIGWSTSYQYKLENTGAFETISEKTFNEINQLILRYYPQFNSPHEFTGCIVETYVINGQELKRRRDEANITQKEFAIMMGWSKQYQFSLEDGIVATISKQVKEMIETGLNIMLTV